VGAAKSKVWARGWFRNIGRIKQSLRGVGKRDFVWGGWFLKGRNVGGPYRWVLDWKGRKLPLPSTNARARLLLATVVGTEMRLEI
jgi:hypothetical protein